MLPASDLKKRNTLKIGGYKCRLGLGSKLNKFSTHPKYALRDSYRETSYTARDTMLKVIFDDVIFTLVVKCFVVNLSLPTIMT